MQVIFTSYAKEDYDYWKKKDSKIYDRINLLIEDIKTHPFAGLGKPEPLKFNFKGYWSRRINHEHRLVYKIHQKTLYIAQCRYHYK